MNSKKQQIIKAAYSLFIQKGFIATSIQDILDEATVSKGTFYNYFTSKSECLMAIMDSINNEIHEKREAALSGKSPADPQVLSNQLAIRIQLGREKNLYSLYESIFYSQDEDLRKFSKLQYLNEMKWSAQRIVQVYGENSAPFAADAASFIHGTIQQVIHLWKMTSQEELPIEKLANFTLRRTEASLRNQIETNDRFLPELHFASSRQEPVASTGELRRDVKAEMELHHEDKHAFQLLTFLYDELAVEEPRKALITSVLTTLVSDGKIQPELFARLERII